MNINTLGRNIDYLLRRTKITLSQLSHGSSIPKSTLHNWTVSEGQIKLRIEILNLVDYFNNLCEAKKIKIKKITFESLMFHDLEEMNRPTGGKEVVKQIIKRFTKNQNQLDLFGKEAG